MKRVKISFINAVHPKDKILIFIFLLICAMIYSFISIRSHEQFQTFGWDLGYFDQLIWKISRGIYPFSTLSNVNLLAGHFAPILFLFAPLYWIWSDPKILLISQAFLVVFAGWPLYLLSYFKTRNIFFSFTVVFSYIFFIGTQWTILNEFHETAIVPLFLSLIFLGLEKNNKSILWIGIIGLLLVKEEFFLLMSSLGLMIYWHFKRKRLGLFLTIFSIVSFFFLTSYLMPAISEKGVYQHEHLSDVAKNPKDFILKIFTDPLFAVRSLITPIEKVRTLVISLLAFAILPIFAPLAILLPLIEQFLVRFLYTGPQYTFWQNVNHHAAPAAMLLPIASVYGVIALRQRLNLSKRIFFIICPIILLMATLSQDILLKAPIHSIFKKQFYENSQWINDNKKILIQSRRIPTNIAIATQNSMFPYLSQREKIYLLPEIKDADFIVVDLYDGPNKYAPLSYDEMKKFINKLIDDGQFEIIQQAGKAMLLKKLLK